MRCSRRRPPGATAARHASARAAIPNRLLLFAIDPAMADAVGMRAGVWNAAIAAWRREQQFERTRRVRPELLPPAADDLP